MIPGTVPALRGVRTISFDCIAFYLHKFLCIVLLLSTFSASGQQHPVLSQYMFNQYYFNPAYSGQGELYSFSLLHRTQWAGYEDYTGSKGAPATQLFTATANLDSTGHGFGLMVSHDRAGLFRSLNGEISYTYRIAMTTKSTLAFGVRGGIVARSVDQSEYIIKHPDDPNIEGGKQRESKPTVTLGVWYNHEKYYAGVSAKGFVTDSDFEMLGIENERDIILTAGYHFKPSDKLVITPSAQLITNTDRTLVQGGAMLVYNHVVWGGLTYQHEESASVLLGFSFLEKKFRLGYALDITVNNRDLKSGTSHEIMLNYRLGKLHKKQIAKSEE